MLNEHKINRISLFSSIILHLALLIIFLLSFSDSVDIADPIAHIPIEFSIKEVVIKKPSVISKAKVSKPSSKPSKSPMAKHKDDRNKPLLDSHKDPYYPKEAINFSLEGTVVVDVLVNTKGRVSRIRIIKSSGHSILDEAFISTIKSSYIFKPKRVDGVNMSDTITLSHTFSL